MKLKDLINILNEIAPIQYSEHWDNPGLLVGDEEQDIETVYIALDATSDVIEAASEARADLLLTHHPLIFRPLNRVSSDSYVGRRVMKLVSDNISLFSMHTDFDVTQMGIEAASMLNLIEVRILEPTLTEDIGLGAMGYLKEDLSLRDLAEKVKKDLNVPFVKVYGDPEDTIVKVAILPGSGSSGIDSAAGEGCDVLITGDIGHHDGTDALEKGINIIDAGHFGVEKLFIGFMSQYLTKAAPELKVIEDKVQKSYIII